MELIKDVDLSEPADEQEDEKQAKFKVSNPIKQQGHIKYTVTGIDDTGDFEESRRFKEFFALRNTLL